MYDSRQPCAVVGGGVTNGNPFKTTSGVDSCQPSHRSGIRVTLDADQLSCKEEGAARLELKGIAQQLGRIDKGVAMQAAVAKKLRLLQDRESCETPASAPHKSI